MTVKALQRHLKEHHQPYSKLKKDGLVKQCERHAAKCRCKSKEASSLPELPAVNADVDDYNERVSKLIKWTSSLKEWPPLTHSLVMHFKATDKHNKAGYGLFRDNKVENMIVGIYEDAYFCKGRIAPAMKKNRYSTVIKIKDGIVEWSDCECAAGKGRCKHAIALLYAVIDHIMSGRDTIPESLACTSQPRQWGRVSARPVDASQIPNFSALVPRTVCYDPDRPESAVRQSLRGETQLDYSSLPAAAAPLHGTRKDILTSHHPFWRAVVGEYQVDSDSIVKTEPKR